MCKFIPVEFGGSTRISISVIRDIFIGVNWKNKELRLGTGNAAAGKAGIEIFMIPQDKEVQRK